jgi:hypothetical protein
VALSSAEINQQELGFLKAETMECATVRRAVLHLSMLLIYLFKNSVLFVVFQF